MRCHPNLSHPAMRGQNNRITTDHHERSWSQTLRFTYFKTLLYSWPWLQKPAYSRWTCQLCGSWSTEYICYCPVGHNIMHFGGKIPILWRMHPPESWRWRQQVPAEQFYLCTVCQLPHGSILLTMGLFTNWMSVTDTYSELCSCSTTLNHFWTIPT